jgi:hypothetical protein
MNEWNILFTETAPDENVSVDPTADKEVSETPSEEIFTGGVLMAPAEDTVLETEEAEVIVTEHSCPHCTTTVATEPAKIDLQFKPDAFLHNMKHMGIGMVTIFMIIGIIICATALINKIFSKKK